MDQPENTTKTPMQKSDTQIPDTKEKEKFEIGSKTDVLLKRSTKAESLTKQKCILKQEREKQGEYDRFKPVAGDIFTNVDKIRSVCGLYPGETMEKAEKTSYSIYLINWVGIFVITDFRMIFCFQDESKLAKMKYHPDYFHIPFFQIEKVTKIQDKEKTASSLFEVTLKDTRVMKFYLWEEKSTIFDLLKKKCFPKDPYELFGFSSSYNDALCSNASKNEQESTFINGWELYKPLQEFQRQGLLDPADYCLRICEANKDFKLFPTYPEILMVHKEMDDKQLVEASRHRTKNRLPALSFFYGRNKKNEKTKAAIWRSSQTKSGIMGSKNSMDVTLLNKISKLCSKLIIFDARPYLNAVANKANGGGFENVEHYDTTEIVFCDIDNIHAVRNSLNKLQQLCLSTKNKTNQKFWSSLEETKWYSFIHLLLKYSYQIARRVRKNCSVLIHCSDGWDRTSQLVSISQLLLDPYYRTIKGFGVLIEKDWLSFGHQFGIRNGIYIVEPKEDQRSPIFLQFLDCIHQLLLQYPNAFEFKDDLLVFLANHYNSNLYGTFMYNSENERRTKNAKTTTTSVWTDVFVNISQYKNPFYQYTNIVERLKPDYSPSRMAPWFEFFMQYNYTVKRLEVDYPETGLTKVFRTQNEFYEYNQEKDAKKYESLQKKYDTLKEFVSKVQLQIKDEEKFKEINEEANNLLTIKKEELQIIPKKQTDPNVESSSSEDEKKKEAGDEDLELYLDK